MNWAILLKFLGDIAWPVTVLSLILLFRTQISDAINNLRSFEGPGDLKATFDPRQVERIVEEGRAENASASEVAQRIVEQAVVDERELRILRGLLGEQTGRQMNAYQSAFYRPAIDSLISKGMIRPEQGRYFLTDKGLATVREHLIPGLDHGVGQFRPLSITRQHYLLAYHGTAMNHKGLCQVF